MPWTICLASTKKGRTSFVPVEASMICWLLNATIDSTCLGMRMSNVTVRAMRPLSRTFSGPKRTVCGPCCT